jgi:hypothetical protein
MKCQKIGFNLTKRAELLFYYRKIFMDDRSANDQKAVSDHLLDVMGSSSDRVELSASRECSGCGV